MSSPDGLRAAVERALNQVVDPCSQAMGVPLGLAELGLARVVAVGDDGLVDISLRLTSPCCAYGPMLADALERRVEAVGGVEKATVLIDTGSVWSPAAMAPAAASRLHQRRARTLALTAARPYDWSSRVD